ncbi:hypothetical protein FB45DRAFT_869833 [Roridomyces roridus]|uniref:RED-like N-terminal domain-containing protein n=1 Tax=Roridomyces roridus TaxID=1738132 RepID=A0AAD7BJS3_9AGAR|nr:hypothetical protein FB45DRAFT_869833 [Roridomyces roridus]
MDQDSFRRLLESRSAGGSQQQPQRSRGSLLAPGGTAASKRKTVDASEPAFKPRKVTKTLKYRDRAAERRVGEGNDYAEVESVLEDLQQRQAVSDEQRKYLGGDGDHSILVKGLDVALLEQNKAKAASSTVDDDSLEQAFMGVTSPSQPTVPKKRTREDIVRELKEKRGIKSATVESTVDTLEAAKKQGKFKPIGFKPIGGAETKTKKAERKKKKRKIEPAEEEKATPPLPDSAAPAAAPVASSSKPSPPKEDPPEDDDFDIFAGAEEYEADFGDDDDEDTRIQDKEDAVEPPGRKWFEEEEPELDPLPSAPKLPLPPSANKPPSRPIEEDGGEDDEPEQMTRLVPLEGSAVPSIKDLLAMDEAANSSNKRKKRKDKKKGGQDGEEVEAPAKSKMSAEDKVERDYKRLKSYTDKQAA